MPERLLLTGPPEQAAAQLIADLERRGIMKHHELQDSIVKNHELKKKTKS